MALVSPVVQLNQTSCLQIAYAAKATLKIYLGYFTSSGPYQEQEIFLRYTDPPQVSETKYLTIVPPLDAGSPDSLFKIKLEENSGSQGAWTAINKILLSPASCPVGMIKNINLFVFGIWFCCILLYVAPNWRELDTCISF